VFKTVSAYKGTKVSFPGQWGTTEALSLLGAEFYVINLSLPFVFLTEIKCTSLPLPLTVKIMDGLSTAGPVLRKDCRSHMQLCLTAICKNVKLSLCITNAIEAYGEYM
jgi:hypothetical protein